MTSEKNTFPATLATVKHGGCVRLATVPYDRARELIGDAYNAGTHGIGYSQQAMELHDAVITAQPSPGGQGDAREQFEEYRGGDCERDAQGYYVNARTAQDWAMWQAALAARQPVGSMSSEASQVARGMVAHCIEHRLCMGMGEGFSSFDPDVEHPFVQELREFAEGTRQPVGEPVAYMDLGAGGYMDVGTDLSDKELAALPKGRHMLGIIGTYGVDGYKPAQAVDLGEFLPAVRMLVVSARTSGGTAGRDAHLCEALDRVEALLPKADSQAVGNG